MISQAKRQNAAMMALLVFFFSVFPVKRSQAFAPPLVLAAYMTASTGAGTYTIAALAGAIGITGLYFTIKDAEDNAVRIPVGPNAENMPPAPAAPSVVDLTPASTSNLKTYYANAQSGCAPWASDTYEGACNAIGGEYQAYNSACIHPTGCTTTWGQGFPCSYQAMPGSCSVTAPASCPAGYSISGSTCVLSNARQSQDDKACDLLIAQGAFATADDVNCGSTVDSSKVAPMLRDGKVIAYGTNSSGQPLMWEVTPGPQTYTITEYEQIQAPTQTQVKQTTATIDAATSAVTSVQTQTSPGSISSPSATSAPTTTTPSDPTTAANTPTVTRDQTKLADIQFPTDYARTGEAKTAADSITELMKPSSEVVDPTVPDWADNWGGTFNPLKAWSMPNHSSACPVSGFDFNGSYYTFDSHCQLMIDHWSGLQTAAVVVWTIAALFILLGA